MGAQNKPPMPRESKIIKLQKRFAYRYKDREHYKHVLTVPDYIIQELGWQKGVELQPSAKNGKLIFEECSPSKKRDLWDHKEQSLFREFLLGCHKWLGGDKDQETTSIDRS